MFYHETQIKLTYNSNHIEGSKLTEEQTRYIFETKTVGALPFNVHIYDVIKTNNHFRCIDYVIDNAMEKLSENFILTLQKILKEGTEHAKTYGAGKYKSLPNVAGGITTVSPSSGALEIKKLITWYNSLKKATFKDIVEFYYRLKTIHPFQDGNGRIGRLIAFKQCLKTTLFHFIFMMLTSGFTIVVFANTIAKKLFNRNLPRWSRPIQINFRLF